MTSQEPIAVIGMAATMPGANDLDEFWANLRAGRESITFGTDLVDQDEATGRRWIHARGVLDSVRRFDFEFFGIPRREAEVLDPQHRVLLEHAWSAMEEAGYDPLRLIEKVAVYTTAGPNTYAEGREFGAHSAAERLLVALSNAPDTLATRISYKLGLTGESLSVRTACSSSLVAVHLAAEAVRSGRADLALAGAVNIRCHETLAYEQQDGFILSADGHTRAYDHRGTGYVEGDGVGVVVLRRLSDALAAGDHVHAVLRAGGINNDGKAKAGFSAPGVEGQSAAISAALAGSGVPADSIRMVEGHGTGTAVGDPIEVRALTRAYREHTDQSGFCALTSVKANIGHLGYASGMAGLLKAILSVRHGELPPAPDFEEPNPDIDFADSPFYVNRTVLPWPEGPRRAGVSSFGMGGTNVHVIVEQAPDLAPTPTRSRADYAVLLSARTENALRAMRKRLLDWLSGRSDVDLADLAFTLSTGRRPQPHRWAAVVSSTGELAAALAGESPATWRTDELADLADEWARGAEVDWAAHYAGLRCRRLSLPTYPWQGEELWVPVVERAATPGGAAREPIEQEPVERWLYRQVWPRTALPRPHHPGDLDRTDGVCLVLGDNGALTTEVRDGLAAAGLAVVPVELSTDFDVTPDGVIRVRAGDPVDLARLVDHTVAEIGPITRVVHLWAYGAHGERAMSVGVLDTLSLVRALTAAGQAPEMWVLTENAQPVDAAAAVDPAAAAVLGLCQVVPQEHPDVRCHGIDFASGRAPTEVVAALLAELASPPESPEVAYRGGDRHVPSFERLATAGGVTVPVRPDGVYLVAGGSGRMGLAIAQHIAASGGRRIALVSRRGVTDEEAVLRLRGLGAEVLTLRADIADEQRMAAVVGEITRRWGPVNGVVHAAGIEGGGGFSFVADTSADHAQDMLRPKTDGIAVLDRVTRTQPLDFCLVCSSLSAVLGGITFGVYTAANRYLDAYAAGRRANGAPWVSVDWDVWRFDDATSGLGAAVTRTAMTVDQATGLLGSIVAGGHSRLVVSTVPLADRVDRVRKVLRRGEIGDSDPTGTATVTSQEQLCDHLKEIVGELVGVTDLDDDDELLAVGCDSLTFLEVLARWQHRIGVTVPIARLWGCRTFTDLAEVGWQVVNEERTVERDAGRRALRYLAG